MKVWIIDFKKEHNKFVQIKLRNELGEIRICSDTSELKLLVDTLNLTPENFKFDPNFRYLGSSSRSTNTSDAEVRRLASKIDRLNDKLELLSRGQTTINRSINGFNTTLPQLINGIQLPTPINTNSLETKLDNINANVISILNNLGVMDAHLMQKANAIETELISQHGDITNAFVDINSKLDPMWRHAQKEIFAYNHKPYEYPYPECKSDKNTWRYKGLPSIATHFALDPRTGEILDDITTEAEAAFNEINNAESNITLTFDAKLIALARTYVETYDRCRKVANATFEGDLGNAKEAELVASDIAYYSAAGNMVSKTLDYGLKEILYGVGGTELVKAGGLAAGVGLLLGEMTYHLGKIIADDNGLKIERFGSRARHLDDNSDFKGSVLASNKRDAEMALTSGDIHNNENDKLQYLTDDGTYDKEVFLSAMLYDCRCFTIESLNSLVAKRCTNVFNNYTKHSEYHDYLSQSNAKDITEDRRLMYVYLRYYQQPYFGYNVTDKDKDNKKVKRGTKDYIQGTSQTARKVLFDCLQNAYFASKVMLFLEDDNRFPIRKERIEWLHKTNWIIGGNAQYHNEEVFLKKLLAYMKLCLCIQNLSPLCADKLLQMFCDYGNIDYKVTRNTDDSFNIY